MGKGSLFFLVHRKPCETATGPIIRQVIGNRNVVEGHHRRGIALLRRANEVPEFIAHKVDGETLRSFRIISLDDTRGKKAKTIPVIGKARREISAF